MKRRFLRVELAATDRTDLMCIHCGRFGAGKRMLAVIAQGVADPDAWAGVHPACIKAMRAPRVLRAVAENDLPPAFRADSLEQTGSQAQTVAGGLASPFTDGDKA